MKVWLVLASLLLFASFVLAQDSSPSPGCTKNVSFAIAEGGQPVPAIPKFAYKWLGGNSRKEAFSKLCFSQTPSVSLPNYLVIFSTSESAFQGLRASAHTYRNSTQGHETAPAIDSYGGTWTFAYTGVSAPAMTNTLDLKRDDKPKVLDVRAYDHTGRTIAEASLANTSRDKLLEKIFADILKDAPAPAESRKPVQGPLGVYYVNCDVEGQPVSPQLTATALDPPAKPAAPAPKATTNAATPPPPPQFEVWSSPAGADIFLDGQYVGQTPSSIDVSQGEHTVVLRKKNFAIWQRKLTANTGKRRIGGNLEQKVLNLD